MSPLFRTKFAIILISAGSLVTAFLGDSAYSLLEEAYALTLVGLLVPLTLGLYQRRRSERAALVSMAVGCGCWGVHLVAGWESFAAPWLVPRGADLPVALTSTVLGLAAYLLTNLKSPPVNEAPTLSAVD